LLTYRPLSAGSRVTGAAFLEHIEGWLNATPGEQCVRAGAGAYANALKIGTCRQLRQSCA